jgi:acyl carrier protein
MKAMEQQLRDLLADVLGVKTEQIDDSLSMKTVKDWDSLKHIQIITALEEVFDMTQLTTDEIVQMTNIIMIRNILRGKGIDI